MPLTPTMLLMPSAIPRWLAGNASVMIAAELASRKARADPLHDAEDDQVGRARRGRVIQSTVSSSEATV